MQSQPEIAEEGCSMEPERLEEAIKVVDANLSRVQWRLRSAAKRRLEIDILALCTGLRPVVMVDYGGKMPELEKHLCSLLHLCHQESSILKHLKVMTIEDMIYLIHDQQFLHYISSSLAFHQKLHFVDLEEDPPKMEFQTEESGRMSEFVSIQKYISSVFCPNKTDGGVVCSVLPHALDPEKELSENSNHVSGVSSGQLTNFRHSVAINLSSCMQDTQVTLPTLNGGSRVAVQVSLWDIVNYVGSWLLGYPVVYLFRKDLIGDAVYNLSTKSLHIFQVLVGRKQTTGKGSCQSELMSFSVPYDLSLDGENEPWAKDFLAHMEAKFEKCKQHWEYLRITVNQCYPQSIAL